MTHDGGVFSVAFSPDGKYVVSGSADRTARVWEAVTGKEVARMTHDNYVYLCCLQPGWQVCGLRKSRMIPLAYWEAATGKEIARMTHDESVYSVAFSPDGNMWSRGVRMTPPACGMLPPAKEVARMTHDDASVFGCLQPGWQVCGLGK